MTYLVLNAEDFVHTVILYKILVATNLLGKGH